MRTSTIFYILTATASVFAGPLKSIKGEHCVCVTEPCPCSGLRHREAEPEPRRKDPLEWCLENWEDCKGLGGFKLKERDTIPDWLETCLKDRQACEFPEKLLALVDGGN